MLMPFRSPGYPKLLETTVQTACRVVDNNWTTALIFESDVDWDVRVKDVLSGIVLASEAVLSSPAGHVMGLSGVASPNTVPVSPYGNGWDVLWLGHCGMQIKQGSAIVAIENDESVLEAQFVHSWDVDEKSPLEHFPPHSRIIFQTDDCVCTIAYAVTQMGARQLLNSLGLHRMNNPVNIMIREWCLGDKGDDPHVCMGTIPPALPHTSLLARRPETVTWPHQLKDSEIEATHKIFDGVSE